MGSNMARKGRGRWMLRCMWYRKGVGKEYCAVGDEVAKTEMFLSAAATMGIILFSRHVGVDCAFGLATRCSSKAHDFKIACASTTRLVWFPTISTTPSMTNKAKSRRRNGRNQALTSQEPHVPVNNFSLEELRRLFAETQTIPPTARPRQYVASRSTVIMPMADGTSLLRVIQRELARHGVGRAVESADDFESGAAETPDRKDTPVHGQAQRGRALEAPRPVQADDEPSRPSEAPGKVETRSAKSDATGTAAAPEVDHSLDVATPFRANNEPSRPSTERGEVETRPSKLKGKPATAAATPSKTIDPNKASMTLRLRGVFFQNDNDRFQENRVPLDEKIPQLQFQLQRLCSLLAHSDRLEAIARDNRCFHFRVRPDFTTDITRNFYIVDNEHSYCRLERVRDMFHTHQIEAAKRNGVPLMLKFYLAMEEGDRPGDELSRHSFQEQWAPQFGFYAMEWDEDEQGVRTCPMNPSNRRRYSGQPPNSDLQGFHCHATCARSQQRCAGTGAGAGIRQHHQPDSGKAWRDTAAADDFQSLRSQPQNRPNSTTDRLTPRYPPLHPPPTHQLRRLRSPNAYPPKNPSNSHRRQN
ncbi:hypothetical protein DOTSEDRAFT_50509 [Dothistroma septosporum NZE10]|uniref:Uncharacterized protein n=1 Tax=Dothistroma septosporum (strain NZE10 / CBS 128990) TaxID=675120 RepID=N1PX60_DOTSN|nr:hypothetical protein DOTSEDRAFT_50509 [Dothistroma septosporum NZE10]